MTSLPSEMRADSLQRIGIKFFVVDSTGIRIRDFVPVFHSWIQKQCLEGHLLIDVHDYSHIHNGPGVLLVAHEGNLSIDQTDGRMGLFYYRKQPLAGPLPERLRVILKSTLEACVQLEDEPAFEGKLQFRTDEIHLVSNDRLAGPNDAETLAGLRGPVSAIFEAAPGGITMTNATASPKDRFTASIRFNKPAASVRTIG